MTKRYLLNFGDSWAHAQDAGFEFGYSMIMAEYFARHWQEQSRPSSSTNYMVHRLHNFLQKDYVPGVDYMALFFITAQERQLSFDADANIIEFHPNFQPDFYRNYYNDAVGEFYLNTAILSLQYMCQRYGIQDHYLLGWQMPNLWPEIDTSKFYQHGRSNAISIIAGPEADLSLMMAQEHPGLISKTNGHPSKIGHEQIARAWINWIEQQQALGQ